MENYNDIPNDSPAGKDADDWDRYITWCDSNKLRPTLSGYILWLDESTDNGTTTES